MNDAVAAKPRLAVLHTVPALVDFFRPLLAQHVPEAETFHMADESLLKDMIRTGESPGLRQRLALHAAAAEAAGASGLLVTCSSITPLIDAVRPLSTIPVFKIDDAMAAAAVRSGPRIALLCTTPSTVGPSTRQLEDHAAAQGVEVRVTAALVGDAFAALQSGDRAGHDELVIAEAGRRSADADVIVLAQATLARLRDEIEERVAKPVLASPAACLRQVAEALA